MPRKNSLRLYQCITAASMTGNITSAITGIEYVDNVGLELDWTGTPTGTFSVEVSISYAQDAQGNVTNAGAWNALTLSPAPAAAGAAGSYYIELNQLSATWIRVKYTAGSSTGTLNGYICAKEI